MEPSERTVKREWQKARAFLFDAPMREDLTCAGGTRPSLEPTKSQRVEGRVTRILYVGPQERSPLEVVRNYEPELKKNGFETLYTCTGTQCGDRDGWFARFYLYPLGKQLSQTPARGSTGRPQGRFPSLP